MKKFLRVTVLMLFIGLILLMGGGLALAMYYRENFPVNTWINGVYCTGKTIAQVNEELADKTQIPTVTITDMDGQSWELDTRDADIRADYTAALRDYLRENATVLWMDNLQEPVEAQLTVSSYLYDEAKLKRSFERLEPLRLTQASEQGVFLEFTGQGYLLRDGNGRWLDPEKAFDYLTECLAKGETAVDLEAGQCYVTREDSQWDKRQRDIWDQLQEFFDCRIVYDMGAEQIPLSEDITSRFLATDSHGIPALDERGKIMLSEAGVRAWVEELAAAYNTVDTTLEFQSTRGDIVSVEYDTYGTELDVEAEVAYLMEALRTDRDSTENHIPAYLREGFVRGLNDIGGTYIEIDMTQQHMYYYVDWELVLDTDVVTGNTGRRMGTPEGVNFVYNKQRNRILRGPDYATPVKYWMPVRGNVGIHDANWRAKFGGEIYKKNGSHGCINTPTSVMSQLYDMAEIGTPVIMFY